MTEVMGASVAAIRHLRKRQRIGTSSASGSHMVRTTMPASSAMIAQPAYASSSQYGLSTTT